MVLDAEGGQIIEDADRSWVVELHHGRDATLPPNGKAQRKLTLETPTWEHEREVRAIAIERKKRGFRSTHDC
jgi:hypothetical protein